MGVAEQQLEGHLVQLIMKRRPILKMEKPRRSLLRKFGVQGWPNVSLQDTARGLARSEGQGI